MFFSDFSFFNVTSALKKHTLGPHPFCVNVGLEVLSIISYHFIARDKPRWIESALYWDKDQSFFDTLIF